MYLYMKRCSKLKSIDEEYYQTEILHNGPIYATSDIHGDIHAFIISLRDCARVIGKNYFNNDVPDPYIEEKLKIDISVSDGRYDESLGYQWIGGNAYVVICGDMIDPKRMGNCKKGCINYNVPPFKCDCIYYPQSEIKLLRFINKMNQLAKKNGGRIIKLLGNHEAGNIFRQIYTDYIFPQEIEKEENYYRNQSRIDIFKPHHHGYNLLFEDGCGILIKINNTIFVHGKLPDNGTLSFYKKRNNVLNNLDYYLTKHPQLFEFIYEELINGERPYPLTSPLQDRKWGNPDDYSEAIKTGTLKSYCDDVKENIKKFLEKDDITNYRVVIGHCIQSSSSIENLYNTTFQNLCYRDDSRNIYDAKNPRTGKITPNDQDFIFGITMACSKQAVNGLTDFYVYRVDVGSSREMDLNQSFILQNDGEGVISKENKFLYSKTPQILEIIKEGGRDIIRIIKSKMKNTRIHLPRPEYEAIINVKNSENFRISPYKSLDLSDGHYQYIKYLKYKKKYFELKNIL